MTRDWEDRERSSRGYGRGEDYSRRDRSRDWSDRAGDEVRSWFGNENAERRRRMDEDRDYDMGRSGYSDRGRYSDERGGYGGRSAGGSGYGQRGSDYDPYGSGRGEGYGRGGYSESSRSGMAGYSSGAGGDYGRVGYGERSSGGMGSGGRGYSGRDYGGQDYGQGYRGGSEDRGFFERAGDEISSWFGDEDAQRRRERDAGHRGRGPKNYSRSDDRIREDVSDRLSDDRHIDASDIEVSVSGTEVTLTGTVESRFAKRHAEDLAESCSGVKHVQNNLRVKDRQSSTGMSGNTTGSSGGTGNPGSSSGADRSGGGTAGGAGAGIATTAGGRTGLSQT